LQHLESLLEVLHLFDGLTSFVRTDGAEKLGFEGHDRLDFGDGSLLSG